MTIQERLLSLIDRETGKTATLESSFEDLGLDSLELVSLLQAVDEEFGGDVLDKITDIQTVGDILKAIQ